MTGVASTPCTSTDATIVNATVDHSQSVPSSSCLAGGVGEVVDRADAADPEEGDGPALAGGRAAVARGRASGRQGDQPGERADHEHQGERRSPTPRQSRRVEQAAGERDAEHQQHEQGQQPLQPLGDLVHRGVVVVGALGGAERHRAGEHGQEPVAADHLADAVRRDQGGEREQGLAALGDAQRRRLLDRNATYASTRPTTQAGDDADHDLADQVPADPLEGPAGHRALGRQQDRGVHERERQAVVEPGLGGQGEPELVGLVDLVVAGLRAGDLHVGGEHRVGRRERRRRAAAPRPAPGRPPSRAARPPRCVSGIADGEQPPGGCSTGPSDDRLRSSSGRSMARPTPISATSTTSSVTCSIAARFSCGSSGRPSGSGVNPMSMPDRDEHHRRRDRPPVAAARAARPRAAGCRRRRGTRGRRSRTRVPDGGSLHLGPPLGLSAPPRRFAP